MNTLIQCDVVCSTCIGKKKTEFFSTQNVVFDWTLLLLLNRCWSTILARIHWKSNENWRKRVCFRRGHCRWSCTVIRSEKFKFFYVCFCCFFDCYRNYCDCLCVDTIVFLLAVLTCQLFTILLKGCCLDSALAGQSVYTSRRSFAVAAYYSLAKGSGKRLASNKFQLLMR